VKASLRIPLWAGILVLVTVYGSLTGGQPVMALLFLLLTLGVTALARTAPHRTYWIPMAGIPLVLTVGSDPVPVLLVSAALIGLFLEADGALFSRNEQAMFAGTVLLAIPVSLFLFLLPGILPRVLLLLVGAGLFGVALFLVRLRFRLHYRGEVA
jgi:hypothetical protein